MTDLRHGARGCMNDERTCTQSGAKLTHYVLEAFAPFSRRFSSRSTASRMKAAMPFSPTRSRIRSLTSSGKRICVGLFPSGGRPMRGDVDGIEYFVKVASLNGIVY